jgi:hypothetical protein
MLNGKKYSGTVPVFIFASRRISYDVCRCLKPTIDLTYCARGIAEVKYFQSSSQRENIKCQSCMLGFSVVQAHGCKQSIKFSQLDNSVRCNACFSAVTILSYYGKCPYFSVGLLGNSIYFDVSLG